MSPVDRFRELVPLAALDALDGQDLVDFREHLPGCPECQAELAAFGQVAGSLGASVGALPPPPALRDRVLASVGARPGVARAPAAPRRSWPTTLAAAVAVATTLGLVAAGARLGQVRERVEALEGEVEQARREVSQLQEALAEARAVGDILARPESQLTLLAGLETAPRARGRVVWNAGTREAVLLVSGLEAPPAGKAYEIWVIGPSNQPVPAGLFQPRPDGSAVVSLPRVEDTARARTFAVTVEPAVGSAAPTGPMVLAGAVS